MTAAKKTSTRGDLEKNREDKEILWLRFLSWLKNMDFPSSKNSLVAQETQEDSKIHIGLIPKVIRFKLFLDLVSSSSVDNVTTRVTWYFRGGCKYV